MTARQRTRIEHSTAAVVIRLAAFAIAVSGILAIPAVLVATATGNLTHPTAMLAIGIALLAIATAAFAVRPLDPLR